ncbi:prepilin-type N-terminal cleavage/methylation domain-containing protein [Proteiniborus sp.]|uniref:PilW family protein n=1 Tax=Proteiniborus sp. TaxID=2079015 RepID=UPI00331E9987
MKKELLDNEGLTLIELILTVVLLGIIISLIFAFFQFNYSTFFRSISKYDIQSNLNNVSRFIEKELRYSSETNVYEDKNEISNGKKYIYFENDSIILRTQDGTKNKLTDKKQVTIENLQFILNDNLITYEIKGKSTSNNQEYTVKSTIQLLNIKSNRNKEGSIIEYIYKGED